MIIRPRPACRCVLSAALMTLYCLIPGCAAGRQHSGEREPNVLYWVGGPGEWTSAVHWAAQSGGTGGAGTPTADDIAVFDGRSGRGQVVVAGDVSVLDLRIEDTTPEELALAMSEGSLTCRRDALLLGGRVDNRTRNFDLRVGRNLDTTGVSLGRGIRIALTGTGWWRYSLDKPHKPSLRTLVAAQKGCTTTLRPVGRAPQGTDIDTENLILGDHTSLLTMDVSEVVQEGPPSVIIEIHQSEENHLDIEADGCRLAITSIEHETQGIENARLQHKLDLTGMERVYDITGAYRDWEQFRNDPSRALGTGPTWTMTGPMDLGDLRLSIEKTCILRTDGHDLKAGRIAVGVMGASELYMDGSTVEVTGAVTVGNSEFPGRLYVGTGTLKCAKLIVRKGSTLSGKAGGTVEVTEEFLVAPDAQVQLEGVKLTGKQPEAGG